VNRFRTLLFSLLIFGFWSCEAFDTSPRALVSVWLIDAPAKWDSVLVEIQGVEVSLLPESGRGADIQKIFLPYEPGDKQVDISKLVAGTMLPVARYEMPLGQITGITLRLGQSNSLFVGDDGYPLNLPEGNTDYHQDVNIDLKEGISYDLIVDFDLEKSIDVKNSTPLTLDFNPTISVYSGMGRGNLTGTIGPLVLRPAVYAVLAGDSLNTHTSTTGGFQFMLEPGTYTVFVDPKNSDYHPDTIFNVKVEEKKVTKLDPITLVKK
jgi:hypothetical protein